MEVDGISVVTVESGFCYGLLLKWNFLQPIAAGNLIYIVESCISFCFGLHLLHTQY